MARSGRVALSLGGRQTGGLDLLDAGDRIENAADYLEERGTDPVLTPALKSFLADLPARGQLPRCEMHVFSMLIWPACRIPSSTDAGD